MTQRSPHEGSADVSTQSAKRFAERRRASTGDDALFAGDILYGADAIAAFLFGDAKLRRRVYNLVEKKALPVFRIGASVCARKSVLLAFIAEQENSL